MVLLFCCGKEEGCEVLGKGKEVGKVCLGVVE